MNRDRNWFFLAIVAFLIASISNISAAYVLRQQAEAVYKECSVSHHEMNLTECVDLAHRCPNRTFTYVGPGCTKYCHLCFGINCLEFCERASNGGGCRVDDDFCAFTCEDKCVGLRVWGKQACMWNHETQRCMHHKDTTFSATVIDVQDGSKYGSDIFAFLLLPAFVWIFAVGVYLCA